jgi:UDP-N-acetylglucosamine diphosphorylase/glucosamine-1-phosphate N-acetyltransferase
MRIAFYEDVSAEQFGPIALTRPLCEIRCGFFTQRERILNANSVSEWGCFTREQIKNVYSTEKPEANVNDYQWLSQNSTLLINSRWIPCSDSLVDIDPDEIGVCNELPVYVTLHPDEEVLLSTGSWPEGLARIAKTRRFVSVDGAVLERPWDIIEQNSQQIIKDYESFKQEPKKQFSKKLAKYEVIGNASDLWISESARIDPYVLFDVTNGPVFIESNVQVSAFTKISGPCYIGSGTEIIRGFIKSGVSAGPSCRLGGEIEATIFHSHANKYHTGFLGHSYICPWVNLGAMTTNSDLKNDYSSVSVPVESRYIKTGLSKVGCYIGDHAKTALGSLFNTGTNVGPFAMMLPGGELLPKEIPAFSRYWHGRLQDAWPLERYLKTAEIVMARRNVVITEHHRDLYSSLYRNSQMDRANLCSHNSLRKSQESS